MAPTRRIAARTWLGLIGGVAVAIAVAVGALGDRGLGPFDPAGGGSPTTVTGTPPSGSATGAAPSGPRGGTAAPKPGADPLAGVTVVAGRPRAPQPYRRAEFGEAWTDDNGAALGHNGCDTRNDILDRDLKDKTYVRTSGCPAAVATGVLIDPYTGATVKFTRGAKTSADVQIDHLVPLAYAWDMGAAGWDRATRVRFANDPRNLLAADGPANNNKKDNPPGRWMPSNEGFHCQYVQQFSAVLREYHLAVDAGSAAVIRQVSENCK